MIEEYRCKAKIITKGITRRCKKEALWGRYCEQHNKRVFEFDVD